MTQSVVPRWGRIEVLVNSAGVESSKPFLDIELEEYERVMRVNAVAPSLTPTDLARRQLERLDPGTFDRVVSMIPAGRAAHPEEVASVIAFLASEEASFVVGHVYNVDVGTAM